MPTIRQCSAPQCNKPVRVAGLCTGHYDRQRRGGDINTPLRRCVRNPSHCKVDDCYRAPVARGYCQRHYHVNVGSKLTRLRHRVKREQSLRALQSPDGARWRPVKGFEGRYEISDDGRVRSLLGHGCYMSPGTSQGYQFVILRKNGVPHNRRVHTLVAAAFLGPRPQGLVVNHIDHNRANNHYTNLEYVSHTENMRKAVEFKRANSPEP